MSRRVEQDHALCTPSESKPAWLAAPGNGWKVAGVCLALTAAVWLIFAQTLRHDFVNIDDGVYVYQNRLITSGLTQEGIGWFFTHAYCDFWAPLLAASQMADWQVFGRWPGGHHLTNVLLFNATVVLLFAVLRRMTGALWRSAFVAAAWAVHPLRVESVAWITERKDMLSGLFFVLTLGAYIRSVREPRSWARHLAVPVLFALAAMCKPSVVTLPFVLLLLDYWPLNRFAAPADARRLLVEKIPLFAVSAALCAITVISGSQTLMPVQQASLAMRLGNAVVSYVIYLEQTFYPASLAAFYPYPVHPAAFWEIALASALLASITAVAIWRRRTDPWLAVGWFWFLGMLIPMIGLVQAGEQAHADRYTYLPHIGLLLAITWTAWHWWAPARWSRLALGGAAAVVLAALLTCARLQTSYWRNSETLWRHTLACTSHNYFAQNNLGVALADLGRQDEAAAHFQAAIAIQPLNVRAQYNLGNLLRQQGQTDAAIECYRKTLAVVPDYFDVLNNLGIALASKGRIEDASAAYRRALALRPDSAEVHANFGHALLGAGQIPQAIRQFDSAVQADPGQANGYDGLGSALLMANRPAEAALQYQKALHLKPDDEIARSGLGSAFFLEGRPAEAVANWRQALALGPAKLSTLNNLAWLLATGPDALRNGPEAVRLSQSALELTGGHNPLILRTLAAAYAEAGRFAEARETAGAALKLATAQSNRALAAKIEEERLQYDAGLAFHEPPPAAASVGARP